MSILGKENRMCKGSKVRSSTAITKSRRGVGCRVRLVREVVGSTKPFTFKGSCGLGHAHTSGKQSELKKKKKRPDQKTSNVLDCIKP